MRGSRASSCTPAEAAAARPSYRRLRVAGAAAREMLIAAAAASWAVDAASCRAERGEVIHVPSGRRKGYGELAGAAAQQPVPEQPVLKDPSAFTVLGRPMKRVDGPAIVSGRAEYGIDVRVPGMLFASIERAPTLGGTLVRFDAAAALRVPGVRHVVPVTQRHSSRRRRGRRRQLVGASRPGCAGNHLGAAARRRRSTPIDFSPSCRPRAIARRSRSGTKATRSRPSSAAATRHEADLRLSVPGARAAGADELHGRRAGRPGRGLGADADRRAHAGADRQSYRPRPRPRSRCTA